MTRHMHAYGSRSFSYYKYIVVVIVLWQVQQSYSVRVGV